MSRTATAEEVASIYRISSKTVRRWCRAGLIPAEIALGRSYRFDLKKVASALSDNRGKPFPKNGNISPTIPTT